MTGGKVKHYDHNRIECVNDDFGELGSSGGDDVCRVESNGGDG